MILKKIKTHTNYFAWKSSKRLKTIISCKIYKLDPFHLFWIAPQLIIKSVIPQYLLRDNSFNKKATASDIDEIGMVVDGDWDRLTMNFNELDVYKSFNQHFNQDLEWQKTSLYKRAKQEILQGKAHARCTTISQLDLRFSEYDDLFKKIKFHGYKSQHENGIKSKFGYEDEIAAHIGRTGEYIFVNGRHRLSIAKILNLKEVPIKVIRRHTQWAKFRKETIKNSGKGSQQKGAVKQRQRHHDITG